MTFCVTAGGLDGADLRFMDESSVVVSSPTNESPPTTLPFPAKAVASMKASNARDIANPSLLQKALIKATAQSKQPPPTVVLKSAEEHAHPTLPTTTHNNVNKYVSKRPHLPHRLFLFRSK